MSRKVIFKIWNLAEAKIVCDKIMYQARYGPISGDDHFIQVTIDEFKKPSLENATPKPNQQNGD